MNRFSIYCVHPISGLSYEEVVNYYDNIVKFLEQLGYKVYHPMVGKAYLSNETEFKSEGYKNPVSTDHAIKERDQWMVRNADVVFADFTGAKTVSIGCVSELAWSDILGKHTVAVMEEGNIHKHAFMKEMCDITFRTTEEAKEYLEKFIKNRI